jgi:XRN 5'-3' exonuclease N-terminus
VNSSSSTIQTTTTAATAAIVPNTATTIIVGNRHQSFFSWLLLALLPLALLSEYRAVHAFPSVPPPIFRSTNKQGGSGAAGATATTSTAIMGIRGFRAWFESAFPTAVSGFAIEGSQEDFDHVLVDMNQLLHIVLRKSRSDGHALTLLMTELDQIVAMATPNQSLVLAMDGPPSAAKLATQRKRRFQIIHKSAAKVKSSDRMLRELERSLNENLSSTKRNKAKRKIKLLTRQKRKAAAEMRTLCISPGTDFMAKAESAILYWAWQRLSASATSEYSSVRPWSPGRGR